MGIYFNWNILTEVVINIDIRNLFLAQDGNHLILIRPVAHYELSLDYMSELAYSLYLAITTDTYFIG